MRHGKYGMNKSFWYKKKVFITGHSGFKGCWLTLWLNSMGAIVKGYSLPPNTNPNLFDLCDVNNHCESIFSDIRDSLKLEKELLIFEPEIIIHMAAQPLVLDSYEIPVETYETNVMGTVNILNISRKLKKLKALLVVTTDKCYENKELNRPFNETESLGGHDPYSSSKACAEIAVSAFRSSFFSSNTLKNNVAIATARAGNVIGGGDWSKNRLLPDFIRSVLNKNEVILRNPNSIRPWQHVLDPLRGYLILCQELYSQNPIYSESWNFGPHLDDEKDVLWIAKYFKNVFGNNFSYKIQSSPPSLHEAHYLKLDSTKANKKLNWAPKFSIEESVKLTADWYKYFINNPTQIKEFTHSQIKEYPD